MAWIYFAISVVFINTSLDLLQRILSVKTENPRSLAFIFNLYGVIFAIVVSILTGWIYKFEFLFTIPNVVIVLVGGFLYGTFEKFRFRAAKNLEASVLITLFTVAIAINFIGSVIFFHEPITFTKLLGLGLIISGILLVSNKSLRKLNKNHLYIGVLTATILGFAWLNDKLGTSYFNPETYTLLMWILPLFIVYSPKISFRVYKSDMVSGSWKLILMAALNVCSYFLFLSGLRLAESSRFIPITQTSILTTVLAGVLLLKETDHVKQKIIASILAFAGVFFLTQ